MRKAVRSASLVSLVVLVVPAACGDDEPATHGFARVKFLRGPQEPSSPYAGTQELQITLHYDDCLADFYDANPNWQQDGENGAPLFQQYMNEVLCGRDRAGGDVVIDCEVTEITQMLSMTATIGIKYKVLESDIENKVALFGPLPCESLAGCVGSVRIASGGAVRGTTSDGSSLWTLQSFPVATGSCNQGAAIQVRAQR